MIHIIFVFDCVLHIYHVSSHMNVILLGLIPITLAGLIGQHTICYINSFHKERILIYFPSTA
jgi:hypothetical protein